VIKISKSKSEECNHYCSQCNFAKVTDDAWYCTNQSYSEKMDESIDSDACAEFKPRECYVILPNNDTQTFLFWAKGGCYTEHLSEAFIVRLEDFHGRRSNIVYPYIDTVKKYENLNLEGIHSILIPTYLLDYLGYEDKVVKRTHIKHPTRKSVADV
jgi:hypothetical protein